MLKELNKNSDKDEASILKSYFLNNNGGRRFNFRTFTDTERYPWPGVCHRQISIQGQAGYFRKPNSIFYEFCWNTLCYWKIYPQHTHKFVVNCSIKMARSSLEVVVENPSVLQEKSQARRCKKEELQVNQGSQIWNILLQ